MKKKIIYPAIMTLWIVGLIVLWEIVALISQLDSNLLLKETNVHIYVRLIYKLIIILSVASISLYMVLSKRVIKIIDPIKQLTNDAKSFSKGEYSHQLRNYSIEELQVLANAFDNMGDELNGTIRMLRHQKTKLESVLAALDEGMIVMDTEGYITEVNVLASDMLNLRVAKYYKNHITTIIRHEQLKKLINEVFEKNRYGSVEVTLGKKNVYCTILPVGDTTKVYEYLLIMRDITQIRNLEEVKYQFVTNVSHELKTPLTSIQGFVETLKEGAIEDKAVAVKFLDIIDIEAKRLYRLIQDILLLSEIENMDRQACDDIIVNEVMGHIISIVKEEADKKHIEIIVDYKDKNIIKNMRLDHFKQLMINLITNAIKYTDRGNITILSENVEGMCVIHIKDTGIGIALESIPHIFERFYRVDKGRSRKSGGTGLGLSIVKHIVQLYDAKIEVISEEGIGTTFTLKFK